MSSTQPSELGHGGQVVLSRILHAQALSTSDAVRRQGNFLTALLLLFGTLLEEDLPQYVLLFAVALVKLDVVKLRLVKHT